MTPTENARERGIAMVLVVFLGAAATLLGVTLLQTVLDESNRSAQAVSRDASFQAAEAGVNDYIAKLVDDHLYHVHYVHPGESTRQASGGGTTSAGSAWSFGLTWTYPSGKDAWRDLTNGYEYNLQVTPPSSSSQTVKIVATGRREGSTTGWRAVEAHVRPSSVADFQMLFAADVSYGSSATTYGKIYAGIDAGGVKHNVTHNGTAYADIYAEGNTYGSTTLLNGAQKYNQTNIRTVIKNPVNFSSFLTSLVDIQRAAQVGGVYLNDPTAHGWRLTFSSGGTFTAQRCTQAGSQAIDRAMPNCGTATTYSVPANGAVYTVQSAIVSGQVAGRVTVASNDDIVVAGDIGPVSPGTDVLGLVGTNDVIVAQWAPFNVTWRAATLAQNGQFRSSTSSTNHGTMTHTGSVAAAQGGYMSMFATRVYQYDTTLLYLQPPWFPTVEDAMTISLFREVKPF